MKNIRLGIYVCCLQKIVGLPVYAVFLPAKISRFGTGKRCLRNMERQAASMGISAIRHIAYIFQKNV
jgi:hypothetical protein